MLDAVIKGGSIVDGTGAAPYSGDVGVRDGKIVAVGERIDDESREVIDADGALVTPGWVDVHTHYDGQATWDEVFEPSASNGVTTLVMGNCGVGFAPVRPSDHDAIIDLMEGVEDIPGAALTVGMPWGKWESFSEYLDILDGRQYGLDIGAQLAHGAVRFYVMGERGAANEDATADDLAEIARLTTEALQAGAVGFSTSRTIGHRSKHGDRPVPGTFAAEAELLAIAEGMKRAGHGVFEAIVAGTIGPLEQLGGEKATPVEEVPLLEAVSKASGRPVTFTVAQLAIDTEHWRLVLDAAAKANAAGADLHPQIIPRSVTVMTSLDTYHLFMWRPTYQKLKDLPLAQRAAEMRKPEVKAAILGEATVPVAGDRLNQGFVQLFELAMPLIFRLEEPIQYEPSLDQSVMAQAWALGKDPVEHMYDCLLEDDGKAFYALLGSNYVNGTLDACREMLLAPHTVTGLSDAGAHVNIISDCSASTFHLTHWARDRSKGEKLPIELLVKKLTSGNASLYGFDDRGVLAAGKKADINVIDFDNLTIETPRLSYDLPTGVSRILQPARGYLASMVNGTVTRRHDADTGARPGRLVRGGR
jgi:N-acyl-D-amino-acid deacylase